MTRIYAFQIKELRNILEKKHTNWDRVATSENILDQANLIINQRKGTDWNRKSTSKRKNYKTAKEAEEDELKTVVCK